METHSVMLAVTVALIAGFLLGGVSTQSKLRRTRVELRRTRWLAEHDQLTGLPNRSGALRRHQLRAAAGQTDVAVLLDLDGFKAVNDTWGHQAGDAHLAAVADRLAAFCAPLDAVASRLAGDEFLLLLPGADPQIVLGQVTALLTRLREPMALPLENAATTTLTTTASAGIAFPEPGGTWAELLRRADIALYQAKILPGHAILHAPGMCQPPLRESDRGPRRAHRARAIPAAR